MKNTQTTAIVRDSSLHPLRRHVPGAQPLPGFIVMKVLCRFILLLVACLFGYPARVVNAQTIQCQSVMFTNSSPCETGRCLLTRWVATVPPSQSLTFAVELSTDRLTWEESTAPITLTESTTVNVSVAVDSSVGFIRLRIIP
jgi:hypothetical protein